MNTKTMAILGFAVLSGLAAMFLTSKMLAGQPKPTQEMQDVLVASRDLKLEEVLVPDLVKVVQMPKESVPAGTFSSNKDLEGRWVQIKTLEGEPILERKLAPKGSPAGLVSRIPKGLRAFAIEVNEQSGVSGFILPDHHVDVIQAKPTSNNDPAEAETVVQNVLVLAAGQTFTRPDDRSIMARTVTLAVTPAQVDVLVAARSRGPLTLSLRSLNDVEVVKYPPKPAPKSLEVVKPTPPPTLAPPPVVAKKPAPRYVTIYRGGTSMKRVRVDEGDYDKDDADNGDDSPAQSNANPAPVGFGFGSNVPTSGSTPR